jgi:hypothetical protein
MKIDLNNVVQSSKEIKNQLILHINDNAFCNNVINTMNALTRFANVLKINTFDDMFDMFEKQCDALCNEYDIDSCMTHEDDMPRVAFIHVCMCEYMYTHSKIEHDDKITFIDMTNDTLYAVRA